MRVYVASSWKNLHEVRRAMVVLGTYGHVITLDWTEGEMSDIAEWMVRDIDAVRMCQALVFLPHHETRGAYTEVGAALALGRRVIAVGARTDPNHFVAHHPAVQHVADLDEALAELEEITRTGDGDA